MLPSAIFLIFKRTGLEDPKITSARAVVHWNVKGKTRKKSKKNTVSFMASLVNHGCTPAPNFSCLSAMLNTGRLCIFFSGLGVVWQVKAFSNQQCQFLTRNKCLGNDDQSNRSMTCECVRTESICPWGTVRKNGLCKQSIFSLSIIGILVARLGFQLQLQRLLFCSDIATFFLFSSSVQGLKYVDADFLFRPAKNFCFGKVSSFVYHLLFLLLVFSL